MEHVKQRPYQLPIKDLIRKIKSKTLKQLKSLEDNKKAAKKFHNYLKHTDSPAPRLYGHPKNSQI